MPQAKAHARYVRISPRKVRAVADAIRGMRAEDAMKQLQFIPAKAAGPLGKVLGSAISNAEHNGSLDKESLKIVSLTVDGGPILKRYRARAFGRAHPIHKRTSHINVVLEGKKLGAPQKQKPQPKTQTATESSAEENKEVSRESAPKQDFMVEKKVGKERKTSFARKVFRRKSI